MEGLFPGRSPTVYSKYNVNTNLFWSFCAIYGCRQTSERPLCQYRHVCHASHKHGAAITCLGLIFAAWQRWKIPTYGWLTNSPYNTYPLPVFKHNLIVVTCPHPPVSHDASAEQIYRKKIHKTLITTKVLLQDSHYSLSTQQFITFSKRTRVHVST